MPHLTSYSIVNLTSPPPHTHTFTNKYVAYIYFTTYNTTRHIWLLRSWSDLNLRKFSMNPYVHPSIGLVCPLVCHKFLGPHSVIGVSQLTAAGLLSFHRILGNFNFYPKYFCSFSSCEKAIAQIPSWKLWIHVYTLDANATVKKLSSACIKK